MEQQPLRQGETDESTQGRKPGAVRRMGRRKFDPETGTYEKKDPWSMAVGERLKAARDVRNLSLEQVAVLTGLRKNTLQAYENGYAVPPVEKLSKLVELYQTSFDKILAGSEPEGVEAGFAAMPDDVKALLQPVYNSPDIGRSVLEMREMRADLLAKVADLVGAARELTAAEVETVLGVARAIGAAKRS